MARRSSKRASGTGDEKDTPQDAVTEEALDAATEAAETPEDATVEAAETKAPDAPAQMSEMVEDASESDVTAEDADKDPADDTPSDAGESDDTQDTADPDDAVEASDVTSDDETTDTETTDSETAETAEDATDTTDVEEAEVLSEPVEEPTSTPEPPPPATQTVVEKQGPGLVPLVIGGVVAAGIGYFASVSGLLPGGGNVDNSEIETALAQQSEVLAALQEQVSTLGAVEAPTVDLSPVTDEITALGARIDETAGEITALGERVATLEDRPVFTGEVAADAAEAAEAVAAMEEQVRAQEEETARRLAEAEEATRAAEEAIAAAEAEAAAIMAAAEAEAAINELRLAISQGGSYAEALADVAAVAEVPEPLSAAADTGVPSLEALQDAFPAAARAALPVALRETAGDGAVDRLTAFVQGQIGGRAVEPREGDDPDAILSRVQAAVTAGDLTTALAELSALPEGARTEMSGWIADAEARNAVVTALDTVADSVMGAN